LDWLFREKEEFSGLDYMDTSTTFK